MPLTHGSSHGVIERNIAEMERTGHPRAQAVAAALRTAREPRATGGPVLYHGSPVGKISTVKPSEQGPLGPGVYSTPSATLARSYAGKEGSLHPIAGSKSKDVYTGTRFWRNDKEHEDAKKDRSRLAQAVEPEMKGRLHPLIEKHGGEGYPLFRRLSQEYREARGGEGDLHAQNLFRRAGFHGLSGDVDGHEVVLFDPAKTERPQRAEGGQITGFPSAPGPAIPEPPQPHDKISQKVHVGPIHSPVAGRTDHLPMHVPSGAYVIPADIIGAMGEGNTMAGFKVAKSMFSQPFYGGKTTGGEPYHEGSTPYGQPMPHKAAGGAATKPVPIVAAGGEYVIHPRDVARMGRGSLDDGHKILDEFVKQFRAKTVKTLERLPGPSKD